MKSRAALATELAASEVEEAFDYHVEKDGLRHAGAHLLIDLAGARHLNDLAAVKAALRRAVAA